MHWRPPVTCWAWCKTYVWLLFCFILMIRTPTAWRRSDEPSLALSSNYRVYSHQLPRKKHKHANVKFRPIQFPFMSADNANIRCSFVTWGSNFADRRLKKKLVVHDATRFDCGVVSLQQISEIVACGFFGGNWCQPRRRRGLLEFFMLDLSVGAEMNFFADHNKNKNNNIYAEYHRYLW